MVRHLVQARRGHIPFTYGRVPSSGAPSTTPTSGSVTHQAPAANELTIEEEEEPAEPRLLVPIERTPLPEVDRAMPVLSLFPAVVGRRYGRYKVGVLKTLQMDGAGRACVLPPPDDSLGEQVIPELHGSCNWSATCRQ